MLRYLSKKLDVNLLEDNLFMNNFIEHLKSLKNRIESGLFVSNPLTAKIKSQYKDYFDLVIKSFRKFLIFDNVEISDDEWSYLVIYILSAIERNKFNKKINVLVVCASGYSTGLMLKNRIQNEYGNTINIKNVVGYYEITPKNIEDIDLIISSVDLNGLVIAVPSIKVSVFLDDEDCALIDKEIEGLRKSYRTNKFEENVPDFNNIDLFEKYFTEKNFLINETYTDKKDILEVIYETLAEDEDSKKLFEEKTIIRENFSSIVFKDLIAIPHPISPVKTEAEVFAVISRKDINWGRDSDKVRLIFYISPAKKKDSDFEKIIRIFTKLLKDDSSIENLTKVGNFKDFKKIILKLI